MKRILLYSIVVVLSLTGAKANPADPQDHTTWEVTANNYQYNMTITTALVFDTTESRDVNDKIAAFVGDDCRGVTKPKTYVPEDDRYLAHLLVYSNVTSGEQITLYMYDHSEDEIVEVAEKLDFASNATYGSVEDPYLSVTTYDVQVKVLAGGSPEGGATVSLAGYNDQTTNQQGVAIFPEVVPSDSIHYSVEQPGYDDYQDSVALIDGPVSDTAHLTLTRSFHVMDTAQNPLGEATVQLDGNGSRQTNAKGKAIFSGIHPADSLHYSVSLKDYDFFEDSIAALPGTQEKEDVHLFRTTYQVHFKASDGSQPLSEASVFLDGHGEQSVDSLGKVQFQDVLPADSIYYSVSAPDYDTYTNSLAVLDSSVMRKVDLSLTSYDVGFEVINGELPLQDARVHLEGYGIKKTDIQGDVAFTGVILNDSIGYHISADGYNTYYDSIAVVDGNVSEKATLRPTTYNSTFIVDNGSTPVANVTGTLEVPGESRDIDFDDSTLPSDFQTGGNALWKVDSSRAFQGLYSIQSGALYDNQFAEISFERSVVTGDFSFYAKVSSEKNKDELIFYIDGKEMGRWSNTGWIRPTFKVKQGTHTFKWVYQKDGSRSRGSDCAWVDYIRLPSESMAIKRDTTSSDGELLFPSLMPHYDSLVYHIRHPKYHNDTGKIFIDDQNVDRNVHLTVDLAFKVSKEFDQKFLPSDSLYLQGYGVTGINSHGYAVYQNVEPTDSLFYRIDCPQYNVDSGYVSALYSDTLSKNLKHTRYDVTFHLSYNDSPLSGLQVELADQPALQTNESGKVTFEQILPDTLGYTIDHPEYLEKTGHFALSSNDTTIDLQVLPVYNLDFIVESGSLSGNIYVDQATVKLMPLDSVATTNSFGEATFEQVTPHDSIFYQVNAQGYYDTTGVVQVKNSDVRQKVTLELKPTLEATNLITPNGDGKNDYWIIYHAERYDAFQVSIYSPNGEKVYSTKNYSENKWNGKYHGEKLPDGVYYYIIRNPSGKTVFTGTINLVN